jgi:hypothetical protein
MEITINTNNFNGNTSINVLNKLIYDTMGKLSEINELIKNSEPDTWNEVGNIDVHVYNNCAYIFPCNNGNTDVEHFIKVTP